MKNNEARAATPEQISRIYGIATGTLANMRAKKTGAKYYKVGRKVLYFYEDFENWVKSSPVHTKDSIDI